MNAPSSVAQARAFLARRFGGDWDGPYLLCGTNQILVDFDPLADRPGVWLWLEGVHVTVPETRLGGQIIEALRDHADATQTPLLAGPAINHGYWASDDGLSHPVTPTRLRHSPSPWTSNPASTPFSPANRSR